MKLPLQLEKVPNQWRVVKWSSSQPFVQNSSAQLIHRPRSVTVHNIGGGKYKPHLAVTMWCGNTSTGTKKFTFLDAPPDGKLLCARCEQKAVDAGVPSAQSLVGRHVHVGKCVAVQKCCIEEEE